MNECGLDEERYRLDGIFVENDHMMCSSLLYSMRLRSREPIRLQPCHLYKDNLYIKLHSFLV